MGQENAGFGLKDGDKVPCHYIHLVFPSLRREKFPLVALLGQASNARLRLSVCF
jgi:hypothetical protein